MGTDSRKTSLFLGDITLFVDEYDGMRPIKTKEYANKKFLLYNACGIPADKLIVEEKFVNKNGEMYLTCKVEYKDTLWGDERCVDINYKVDTETYESWDSFVEDGYLVIVLNERIRTRPDFHRVG